MADNLKVIGYVRRSTDKQDISPEVQADRLRTAAELIGWDLELRFEDVASAKSLEGRPVLAGALADLKNKKFNALAVAKLDRLSRDTADGATMLKQADREGWQFIALDIPETVSVPGRAQAHIMLAIAEMQRARTAELTREGMAKIKATTGKHMGRPPRIPAKVEARIIRLHDKEWSAAAIARLFNEEKVPKGEGMTPKWHHSHILAAVRREQARREATG